MGIIAGLVGLESGRAKDEASRGALAGLENKVFALASLYDLLYRSSDSREVSLDTYLRGIAESLGSSSGAHERGIGLVLDLDSLTVDTKKAESLGLVTVELLTDCLKHAFPDGRRGQVWLRLRKQEGGGVLEVRDDGVGLPPGFTVAGMASLGMNIVDMLASQLHGRLETGRSPEGGAFFRLSF
jgi:two-component sensor histidine kinase